MISALPDDIPVTRPDVNPTVAKVVEPLVQVPPEVPSLSGVALPTQTLVTPVIPAGNGLTVTGFVTKQPVDNI